MSVRGILRQQDLTAHIERFMGFVEPQDNGCWYRYSRARDSGYTTITVDGKRLGAHRFSYAAFIGDISGGMEVDHKCRDRGCVNPEHLELVTRQENLRRRDAVTPNLFSTGGIRERMLTRIDVQTNGCWEWTGAKVRGYGVISIDGKTRYVHRVMFEQVKHNIPKGMDLDHLCRNTACANPDHLEPVTRTENVARMLNKQPQDRCRRGHKYDEVGRTSHGSCKQCWERTYGKRYRPSRAKPKQPVTHCGNGHELAVVGRYKSGGCRACQAEKDVARGQRKNATVERYCPNGHDLTLVGQRGSFCQACWDEGWCSNGHDMTVTGLTAKGACLKCREETRARHAEEMQHRTTCAQGHVLADAGLSNGKCMECAREYARKKYGYVRTAQDLQIVCKNGHTWTDENTRYTKRVRNGVESIEKVCRECAKERNRRYERKVKK